MQTPMLGGERQTMELSVTTSRCIRNMLIARFVIVLFSVLSAGTAIAERWYILSSGSFDAVGAFDLDSITPAPGYPTAIALWVYVHRGIETFDCSPPVNCIATSQLTYYYVDCGRMQAAEIRRIPMNLRGKVIEMIDAPTAAWFPLVWRYRLYRGEDLDEWYTPERARTMDRRYREVGSFCALYNAGAVDQALKSYAPLR